MTFVKENTLPKKTTLLWQIRIILITFVLVALCLYFAKTFLFLKNVAVIIGALGIFLGVLYLPFYFRSYRIILNNDAIIVKYGILIKIDHIMPYKRMIYAQSFESPLAQVMGITALRLKAARSYLFIAEIDKESAQQIIDFLAEGDANE